MKKFILDILFPIKCLGCSAWDEWLCKDCQPQIQKKNKIILPNNKYINGLYYITDYKNPLIQKLIHQLKYNYSQDIAEILGRQLARCIDQNFDYIIPIPLHKKRFCERGFNQAELIARFVGTCHGMSLQNNILIRTKNTKAQAQLDETNREQNTKNAFKLNTRPHINLNNKKILLLDDVYTTGNTLTQAAKILKQNNASEIWCAVVAKG